MLCFPWWSLSSIHSMIVVASFALLDMREPLIATSSHNFDFFWSSFMNMWIYVSSSNMREPLIIDFYLSRASHSVFVAPWKTLQCLSLLSWICYEEIIYLRIIPPTSSNLSSLMWVNLETTLLLCQLERMETILGIPLLPHFLELLVCHIS